MRSVEETDSAATITIGGSDALTLSGISNINGAVAGSGALDLAGGLTTFDGSGSISVASWSLSGAGTNAALDQAVDYSGDFQAGSETSLTLSAGDLTLTGQAGFAGATVSGSDTLYAEGTTAVSGLTVGGTTTFDNTGSLTQSGADVTVGDAGGDVAALLNAASGTYDITDDSGIGLGASALSSIANYGLFEKTGGTGTSVIAPNVPNAQSILVSAATLDFQGAVTGTGTDTISGTSTLEFDSTVADGQAIDFSGGGGALDLTDPFGYSGSQISGFAATDTVDLAGSWSLMNFSENGGGTLGTLTLINGANNVALEFAGSFTQNSFTIGTGTNTIIGHS